MAADVVHPGDAVAVFGRVQAEMTHVLMPFEVHRENIQKFTQGKLLLPEDQRVYGGQGIHHGGEADDAEKTADAAAFGHGPHGHVHPVFHAQIMQAGKQRRSDVPRPQALQYALLPEGHVENVQKLTPEKLHELFKGAYGLGRPRGKARAAGRLGGTVAVVQGHFQHGGQVQPGGSHEIGVLVDEPRLGIAAAAVVARLLRRGSVGRLPRDDGLVVEKHGTCAVFLGGAAYLPQKFLRRVLMDTHAEIRIVQRKFRGRTQNQEGKSVGGVAAGSEPAAQGGEFPVGEILINLGARGRRLEAHELGKVTPQIVEILTRLLLRQHAGGNVLLVQRPEILVHAAVADVAAVLRLHAGNHWA